MMSGKIDGNIETALNSFPDEREAFLEEFLGSNPENPIR